MQAIEEDHEFLLRGDVFPPEMIKTIVNSENQRLRGCAQSTASL